NTILLSKTGGRQDVMSDLAGRRPQQIMNHDQWDILQSPRLFRADPAARSRRITRSEVKRLELAAVRPAQCFFKTDPIALEVAQHGFDASPIGALLRPDDELRLVARRCVSFTVLRIKII